MTYTGRQIRGEGSPLAEDASVLYQYDLNGNLTRKTFKGRGNRIDYSALPLWSSRAGQKRRIP